MRNNTWDGAGNAWDVAGLCVGATALFVGFLITALIPMNVESWQWVVGARIVVQVGGLAWAGYGIARMAGESSMSGLLIGLLIGLILAMNPIRDMATGARQLTGTLEGYGVTRGTLQRTTGSSNTAVGNVVLRDDQGVEWEWNVSGIPLYRLENMMETCTTNHVQVIVLHALDNILALECNKKLDASN